MSQDEYISLYLRMIEEAKNYTTQVVIDMAKNPGDRGKNFKWESLGQIGHMPIFLSLTDRQYYRYAKRLQPEMQKVASERVQEMIEAFGLKNEPE